MSSLPMHRRAFGFVYDVAGLYFTKRVSRSAAELAYFLVLSFFPALTCPSTWALSSGCLLM